RHAARAPLATRHGGAAAPPAGWRGGERMSAGGTLRALLVDPSLFTAPYDAALTAGLVAAGVAPSWAIRPTRGGDRQEIAPEHISLLFYGRLDGMQGAPAPLRAAAKGVAHIAGLVRLVRRAASG